MRKTHPYQYHERNLDEFETVDFRKIGEEVRRFFRFSNEKDVLTDRIVRIIEPKKPYSILDVGCGEGYVIRKICRQVKHCIALDPDPKMLEILGKHVKNKCKVEIVNKKLEDFETTEKFDVVLSSHTLSFFDNKRHAIDKLLNWTKKGGRLILVLHREASEQLQMLKEVFLAIHGREINHIYAETLQTYFARRGFDPKVEEVETVARFPSFEILLGLSYFLFRTDYDTTSGQNKHLIRTYLQRKRNNHYNEIRTLHGIITVRNGCGPFR